MSQPAPIFPTQGIPAQPSPQNIAEAFKPKKAGKKTSHVVVILDESGSMYSIQDATIAAFNEFLAEQKKDKIKTYVSLYKFNGYDIGTVYDHVSVEEISKLTPKSYQPGGGTNLLDAMGSVMLKVNQRLSESKKKNRDSVMIVTMTDGEENMSSVFDSKSIKNMVENAESRNWGFSFIGANVDAFAVGRNLGFKEVNTVQFDTSKVDGAMRSVSAYSSRMKSSYAKGMGTAEASVLNAYTDDERVSSNV